MVQSKPLLKYRVLAGGHLMPVPVLDGDGEPILGADGKVVTKDVIYGPNRKVGDIVETTLKLDKLFNKPNSKKYELLGENQSPLVGQLQDAEERARSADERFRRALAAMSVRELISFCEAEGIDHRNETDKELLTAIVLSAA